MYHWPSVIRHIISSSFIVDALWPGNHHLSDQTSTSLGSHCSSMSSSSSTTTTTNVHVNGRREEDDLNVTLGDGSNTETNRSFKINLSAKSIVAMYALCIIIPFSVAYFFGPLLVLVFHRHAYYAYEANVVRDVE